MIIPADGFYCAHKMNLEFFLKNCGQKFICPARSTGRIYGPDLAFNMRFSLKGEA
jgi:hypothetical protein